MKTALENLLDWVEKNTSEYYTANDLPLYNYVDTDELKDAITHLLVAEKEQIEDAFENGK